MLCAAVSQNRSGSSKVRQDLSLPASSASVTSRSPTPCGASLLRIQFSSRVCSLVSSLRKVPPSPSVYWDCGTILAPLMAFSFLSLFLRRNAFCLIPLHRRDVPVKFSVQHYYLRSATYLQVFSQGVRERHGDCCFRSPWFWSSYVVCRVALTFHSLRVSSQSPGGGQVQMQFSLICSVLVQ